MFISFYTTIYFFVKKFIFSDVYISVNTIFECLYIVFGRERGYQLSRYATGGGIGEGHPKCVRLLAGGGGCHASCVRRHLHYLFSCFWQHFCLIVFCLICRNLILPLFRKDVFVRNVYFCRHEISCFYLKLF